MHVGYLTPEYVIPGRPDGGLANYVRNVAHAVSTRGHCTTVIVAWNRATAWEDGPVRVWELQRTRLPHVFARIPRLAQLVPALEQMLTCRRIAQVVWRLHRRTPFDLLQASSYKAPGWALRWNGRVPMVCRISSYTPMLRSAYGRRRALHEFISDWLEVRQVLDADAAFAPSDFVARVYERLEGYHPRVLRSPVGWSEPDQTDDTFYQRHLAGTDYLLFFGTLCRIKGVDLLAEALPEVLVCRRGLRAVFIGRDDGLPGIPRAFDAVRAACRGLEERLLYHPGLPKSQLGPVISHALGVLMPSRVDNYPNACLEAQMFGIPVVGADESSLEEMIVEGDTGFLARNGDPASLRAAIQRLLAMSAEQRQQMRVRILAAAAAARAEDRVGQLLGFYEQTMEAFRRRR